MRFLLDANTYIQAKNQYYGMDICPAYWDWLDLKFELGELASIEMVGIELKAGNDELAQWARDRPHHFISNDDEPTQQVFTTIVQSLMAGDYNAGSRDNFIAKADPWIIAKASVLGATVVSHESRLEPTTKKVKVPNVCEEFGVTCINTFELLRTLQARFVNG
ncbi:MAG: DUF4411 family protein [Methyloprofundus sp.]|nr:DUF4411 family protein [Methyloprofundus sp.]